MHRLVRIPCLAVLLLGLGGGGGGMPTSAAGESPPETVTTDTLTYCHHLANRLDQLKSGSANPPQAVNDLSVAGRDMCERGSIRGGILRLRSAIVMLVHPPANGGVQMGRSE